MNWRRRCAICLRTRKSSLALQADKKASFGAIVKVMDALKLAGVRNLPAFTRQKK